MSSSGSDGGHEAGPPSRGQHTPAASPGRLHKLVPASSDWKWPQCRGSGEPGPSHGTRTRPCHPMSPGPLASQPLPLCSHLALLGRGRDPAALPAHPFVGGAALHRRSSCGTRRLRARVCHTQVPFLTAGCVRPGHVHTWGGVEGLAVSLCPCLLVNEPLPRMALDPGGGSRPKLDHDFTLRLHRPLRTGRYF